MINDVSWKDGSFIHVDDIHKSFGDNEVLRGVSFYGYERFFRQRALVAP